MNCTYKREMIQIAKKFRVLSISSCACSTVTHYSQMIGVIHQDLITNCSPSLISFFYYSKKNSFFSICASNSHPIEGFRSPDFKHLIAANIIDRSSFFSSINWCACVCDHCLSVGAIAKGNCGAHHHRNVTKMHVPRYGCWTSSMFRANSSSMEAVLFC